MVSLLPFDWTRLPQSVQEELADHRSKFMCASFLRPEYDQVSEPERPDYLLFTSANGVRALAAQSWFGEAWRGLPAYAVGPQTAQTAELLGFDIRGACAPPSYQILADLPPAPAQGLWIAGEDVAHDLPQLGKGLALRHLPLYRLIIEAKLHSDIEQALENDKIRSIFITSKRMIGELEAIRAQRAKQGDFALDFVVTLSVRLGALVRAMWPRCEVCVVDDLESGVRRLIERIGAAQGAQE